MIYVAVGFLLFYSVLLGMMAIQNWRGESAEERAKEIALSLLAMSIATVAVAAAIIP